MTGRLKDKVALVVGAGSIGPGWGNGKAGAVLFAREGASVFAVDINPAAAEETRAIIEGEDGRCVAHAADATKAEAVREMVENCLNAFGRIDVLHNNIGGSEPGGPVEMSEEVWDRQMDYNLKTVFLTCKYVLPVMEKQRCGVIINVGSIGGMRHLGHDTAAYAASKAGLVQLSKAIALQYARKGIRCNTVIPGMMHTPLIEHRVAAQRSGGDVEALLRQGTERVPMGRRGDAWDVAYAALYLASDEAKYVTATEIVVDGGLTAKCV